MTDLAQMLYEVHRALDHTVRTGTKHEVCSCGDSWQTQDKETNGSLE